MPAADGFEHRGREYETRNVENGPKLTARKEKRLLVLEPQGTEVGFFFLSVSFAFSVLFFCFFPWHFGGIDYLSHFILIICLKVIYFIAIILVITLETSTFVNFLSQI